MSMCLSNSSMYRSCAVLRWIVLYTLHCLSVCVCVRVLSISFLLVKVDLVLSLALADVRLDFPRYCRWFSSCVCCVCVCVCAVVVPNGACMCMCMCMDGIRVMWHLQPISDPTNIRATRCNVRRMCLLRSTKQLVTPYNTIGTPPKHHRVTSAHMPNAYNVRSVQDMSAAYRMKRAARKHEAPSTSNLAHLIPGLWKSCERFWISPSRSPWCQNLPFVPEHWRLCIYWMKSQRSEKILFWEKLQWFLP